LASESIDIQSIIPGQTVVKKILCLNNKREVKRGKRMEEWKLSKESSKRSCRVEIFGYYRKRMIFLD